MIVTEDQARYVLSGAFGNLHPMHWPFPGQREPRRGVLMPSEGERMEAQINDALRIIRAGPIDQAFRDAYWRQRCTGQFVEEDAGGFLWRAWAFALGFHVREGTTYPEAIDALMQAAPQTETEHEDG